MDSIRAAAVRLPAFVLYGIIYNISEAPEIPGGRYLLYRDSKLFCIYNNGVIYSGRYTSPSFCSTSFVCSTYGVLRYCPNFLMHFWIDVSV